MYGYRFRLVSLGGSRFAVSDGVSDRAVMAFVPYTRKAFSKRDVMVKWLPPRSAAHVLGVSRQQVSRLLQEGKLKGFFVSDADLWPADRKFFITRKSLERYAKSRYQGVGAKAK